MILKIIYWLEDLKISEIMIDYIDNIIVIDNGNKMIMEKKKKIDENTDFFYEMNYSWQEVKSF